jgi:predicted ATPase
MLRFRLLPPELRLKIRPFSAQRHHAGEIALKSPEPDAAKAQAYFERAHAVARAQQAKSWELRAAMSMARLWRDQGKRQQARDLLAPFMAGSPKASTRSI